MRVRRICCLSNLGTTLLNSKKLLWNENNTHFPWQHNSPKRKVGGMRESIPRQVDKKSRIPEEERGVWGSWGGDRCLEFSRRRKRQTFFSTFLSKNYITTVRHDWVTELNWTERQLYPASGQFLLPENLLTNPVILKCILWEWVWWDFSIIKL